MDFWDQLPSISLAQFFSVTSFSHYMETFSLSTMRKEKKYALPDSSDFLGEKRWHKAYSAWNETGLFFLFEVEEIFQEEEKDSIELFIDTRDLKAKGVVSRFCHHFFFSIGNEKPIGEERTRFRGEEVHPLADFADFQLMGEKKKEGYFLSIFIPASILFGYDPSQFLRLGFCYRIRAREKSSAHFFVSSIEYSIEQHPATWGSLQLVRS